MTEIKEGDIVRVSEKLPQIYRKVNSMSVFARTFKIIEIGDGGMALLDSTPPMCTTLIPTKYLVKVNAEPKEPTCHKLNSGAITIPVEADLTDSFWDAYTADLAKEIVLKTVNCASGKQSSKLGEYAVAVAKSVVENLKKREG